MKYTKTALSFTDQANLLLSRGLLAKRDELVELLSSVNYYRLSAYWYTFRVPDSPDDKFLPNTTMQTVWRRYIFDRHLRLHVMDAIERIEIAIRTQVTNRFSLEYGPFGYLDRANLPGLSVKDHKKFISKIRIEAGNSQEDFVRHYFGKYSSNADLPLWMACELMTFGSLFTLYRGVKSQFKKEIAHQFHIHAPVLSSWLRALNQVRNLCAHHARLWNREFGLKPKMPGASSNPDWHIPIYIENDRIFGILTVLYFLLKQIAPQSRWRDRLKTLLDEYPDIPGYLMGFPADWQISPIWK